MPARSKFRGEAAARLLWKKKARNATVLGLALFLSTEFVTADDREMTQEYLTCLDKAGGVTVEMINCILAETKRQDGRLNDNYKKLISKLSTERKKELLEVQRAWIKFRDTNCRFYNDPAAGTSARVSANECVLNATADRAKELKLLTND
jgi:uncharacterized protein YecT (DUF1311 family)